MHKPLFHGRETIELKIENDFDALFPLPTFIIMKRKITWLALPLLLVLAFFFYAVPLLQTGAGYAAKMMCSCLYVHQSNQTLEEMRKERLNFSVLDRVRIQHEAEAQSVTATFYGLAPAFMPGWARATYLPGRGCVLLAQPDEPLPDAISLPDAPRSGIATDLPLRPDSNSLEGIDQTALSAALDYGMQAVEGGGAHAVLILRKGKLIGERYAPGITADTRLMGWSMTKSITAALVGMRIAEGQLSAEKQPLFEEWQAPDPRAAIRLWDLLRMNSGLEWEEAYGSITDATTMLYAQSDMAAYARQKPLAHPIGQHWAYSSGTTNLLMAVLAETFPNQEALTQWMYEKLFYPIGANSFVIESDQSGLPVGSSYGWAKARDWAKIGQLFLQKGHWEGRSIIPSQWIQEMLEPAKGSQGIYGGQIWLKGPDTPSLPDDAFMLRGFQDQRVIILPSQEVVIVRLGHNKDKVSDFDGLIERVLKAIE